MYDQSRLSELIRFARVDAGSTVIDVYPGDGDWTRLFSDIVGPEGRVYSFVPAEVAHFKIDPVGRMRTLAKEPGRENVEAVSADLVAMPEVTQPADVLMAAPVLPRSPHRADPGQGRHRARVTTGVCVLAEDRSALDTAPQYEHRCEPWSLPRSGRKLRKLQQLVKYKATCQCGFRIRFGTHLSKEWSSGRHRRCEASNPGAMRVRRAGTVIEERWARTLNRPRRTTVSDTMYGAAVRRASPRRACRWQLAANAWGRTRTGTGLPPRDFRTTTAFTAACLSMHLWSGLYLCRPARPRARIRQEPSSLYTFLGSSQRSITETETPLATDLRSTKA